MQTKGYRTKNKENRGEKKQITLIKGFVFIVFSLIFSLSASAQCAMCRAALESEGNTVKAEAVNDGIVYLMGIPYVLVGIVGFVVYRMYRKKKVA